MVIGFTLSGLRDPPVVVIPAALFFVIVSFWEAISASRSKNEPAALALFLVVLVEVVAMTCTTC